LAVPGGRERVNRVANANARRVKGWLNKYKLEHGCVDCGYREHPAALDIDHMAGKTANVSTLKSVRAILAEIERHQCVVRCANCIASNHGRPRPG
jgi:hypothetical protein